VFGSISTGIAHQYRVLLLLQPLVLPERPE
jgi:hypothetical protein